MSGAERSDPSWPCVLSLITQAEVHHGKPAPVNVLQTLHCSETDAHFQPAGACDHSADALVTEVGSILIREAQTTD